MEDREVRTVLVYLVYLVVIGAIATSLYKREADRSQSSGLGTFKLGIGDWV